MKQITLLQTRKALIGIGFLLFFSVFTLTFFLNPASSVSTNSEAPTLSITGNRVVCLCPNETYEEEGYRAYYGDMDLSELVTITQKEDYLLYELTYDHEVQKEYRMITHTDTEPPILLLHGPSTIYTTRYHLWEEPGYTALDHCSGNLSSEVTVSDNVDITHSGSYHIRYEVSDAFGNTTITEREVVVTDGLSPIQKTIYLTFDDGPSYITDDILDILKEENVPATFFVIQAEEEYLPYITRAHDEGHTIGLHSATHQYRKIYASLDAYLADLEKISDTVYQLTGEKSKIIRFPGGSSNTVSSFTPKIMSKIATKVTELGYVYFDWDVDSHDSGMISASQVYHNVTTRLKANQANIVLLHDFNGNKGTLRALRDIIRYGKENGYTFQRITTETPRIIHTIVN